MYWINAHTMAHAAITALKHRSWSHEQEVRFIHLQTRHGDSTWMPRAEFSDGTSVYWQPPLSRGTQDSTTEYRAFPFGRRTKRTCDPSGAIEVVVTGPRCSLSETDVRVALEKNGFKNFTIEQSDCQIR
jgi:hypothetical protein